MKKAKFWQKSITDNEKLCYVFLFFFLIYKFCTKQSKVSIIS